MRVRRLALCLFGGVLAWSPAWAATPTVIIDPGGAPPEVLQKITDAVGAITRLAEDQDVREVSRLRRRAWDAARAALQTQGYFNSTVTLDVSDGAPGGGEFWDISIDTGKQTHVRQLGLSYKGAITADSYAGRREGLEAAWPLKPGMPFINSQWSSAKANLLDDVAGQDFYFARYDHTQATVDPEASEADLALTVDSGPPVRLGELQIIGLKRVPASLIRRYVRYDPGDPYSQEKLDAWQQALQATSFFRGAFVTLADGSSLDHNVSEKNADTIGVPDSDTPGRDAEAPGEDGGQGLQVVPGDLPRSALEQQGEPDEAHPSDWRPQGDEPVTLPVRVQVTEAPARYVRSSIGVDSDHGLRVEGLYTQNVVFGQPVWIQTGAGVDRKQQRAFFDVHLPPTLSGADDSIGVLYEHSDIEGLENSRAGLGWKRHQTRHAAGDSRVVYDVRWGSVVAYDKTRISGAEHYEVPTWSGTWQWQRLDVDAKYDPREGDLVEVGLGVGTTLDTGKLFYGSSLRLQQWWPVGERDVFTARGQIGKVWSHTSRLPQDFSWRTGGSRTIRGYRYQSIGLARGDAVVGAPTLGVASLEYTHYFTDMLGANLFVDAGDAAPSFGEFDWHLGYGAGLAVRTPAGPFYLDLAWAQKDKRLRLQFSLGIAF